MGMGEQQFPSCADYLDLGQVSRTEVVERQLLDSEGQHTGKVRKHDQKVTRKLPQFPPI